ncbi:hypothetical protein HDV00_006281 [Rhizophlyctis rosea]|nr:hypothetical protein HDV00_006281 [Rhizophlyctis rosea]
MATRPISEVLTSSDFIYPFLASTTALSSAYFTLPRIYPTTFATEKSRAWILTLLCATTLTIGCIPFIHSHLLLGPHSMAASPLTDSPLARYLCAFFVAYLITDLSIGSVCYPKHIDPMSGWFHHTLYMIMVIGLLGAGVPGGFCTMGLLELPTGVLALGSVNKKWRNDMVFGSTFFATRILYHAYFIQDLYFSFPGRWLWMVLAGVMPMHVVWFQGWVKQQLRLRKKRQAEAEAAKSAGEKVKVGAEDAKATLEVPVDSSEGLVVSVPSTEVVKATSTKRRSPARPRRQGVPKMRSGASLREVDKGLLHQNRFEGLVSVPSA